MITLAFLSLHSSHLILQHVKNIVYYNLNLPIIIIENSRDFKLKKKIENEFGELVNVYIPDENLGFSKGMNRAFKLAKTNFVFLNPADVFLSKECLKGMLNCINEFQEFTILSPTYDDEAIYKNYEENIYSYKHDIKKKFKIKNKYSLKEVDMIDGTLLINKNKIKSTQLMDENFFIYFETITPCLTGP